MRSGDVNVTCAISRICIYSDMTRPSGSVFPIGYVAELTTPEGRVLGLVGRERLQPSELDALHGLLRHQASELWGWLESEFDLAATMEAGKALDYLAARHRYSFAVEEPKAVPVPQPVMDATRRDRDATKAAFQSFLLEQARRIGITQYESGIRAKFAA
jgi:hypothetical protein